MDTPIDSDFIDPRHFTKTVLQLAGSCPVLASRAIFSAIGAKVLEKSAALHPGLYDRLTQQPLSAPLEYSVCTGESLTSQSLRAAAAQILRDIPFFARMAGDPHTGAALLDAVASVALPAAVAFQLALARDVYPQLYQRSLRTALVSAWLAQAPMASRPDMGMAAAAGLLHDLGMLHLDPILLKPEAGLDTNQRHQLDAHALVSKALLERHHAFPPELLRAVAEHHEYLDGSGYPKQLAGDAISDLGRILSLAGMVATVFAAGRDAPEQHLFVILRMNLYRYDTALVARLMALIKHELDVLNMGMSVLQDPVDQLLKIEQLIADWPAALMDIPKLAPARHAGLALLASQVTQLQHQLAHAGVGPAQLRYIGSDALDDSLQQELTLLAKELAWQLRTLARQTCLCWRLAPEERYPDALQDWLERVDAQVAPADVFIKNSPLAPVDNALVAT